MKKIIVFMAVALLLPLGMNARKKTVKKSAKAKTTKVVKAVKQKKEKTDSSAIKSNTIVIERGEGPLPAGAQPQ